MGRSDRGIRRGGADRGSSASAAGLGTLILEKTAWIGGTSAISAAGVWVPANDQARAGGIEDSPDEALAYIRALAPPGWRETEDHLWQRFVIESPRMLAFVESHSPLRFELTPQSDPFLDAPGAKGYGRMVSPRTLSRWIVGRYARKLRPPMLPHIFSYQEYLELDPYHHPVAATLKLSPRLLFRMLVDGRGMGTALISGLLKGCLDHGSHVEIQARAVELVQDACGDVAGAVVEQGNGRRCVRARHGVVLATGGFEWNAALVAKYFPGPVDFITSPSGNEGDGHAMAERLGAQMARMDQANLSPALPIVYDGHLQGMSIVFHQEPNAIIVDRTGHRFVDEFRFNIGEVLDERDQATGEALHLPAWLVTDSHFLRLSPMTRWFSRHDNTWMVSALSIEELARRIGLPERELCATVERYNGFCVAGFDPDFRRGTRRPTVAGHGRRTGNLLAITHPPFLAMPFSFYQRRPADQSERRSTEARW
jgi:3-oxosteroid 1-dehydrogenase